MLSFNKSRVLEQYKQLEKQPPQWVIDAPEDSRFARGFLVGHGHVPLHIVGTPRPRAQPGVVSIELD